MYLTYLPIYQLIAVLQGPTLMRVVSATVSLPERQAQCSALLPPLLPVPGGVQDVSGQRRR